MKAIWISVGCRILIGVVAGWLWVLFTKIKLNQFIALPIVGFVGSMVNTVTVMGSIYFLFAQQYAEAKEVALTAVFGPGDGNCDSIRYSGSNRSSNSRSCTWKSTCCSFPQDEPWGCECGICKITDEFKNRRK